MLRREFLKFAACLPLFSPSTFLSKQKVAVKFVNAFSLPFFCDFYLCDEKGCEKYVRPLLTPGEFVINSKNKKYDKRESFILFKTDKKEQLQQRMKALKESETSSVGGHYFFELRDYTGLITYFEEAPSFVSEAVYKTEYWEV